MWWLNLDRPPLLLEILLAALPYLLILCLNFFSKRPSRRFQLRGFNPNLLTRQHLLLYSLSIVKCIEQRLQSRLLKTEKVRSLPRHHPQQLLKTDRGARTRRLFLKTLDLPHLSWKTSLLSLRRPRIILLKDSSLVNKSKSMWRWIQGTVIAATLVSKCRQARVGGVLSSESSLSLYF